MLNLTIGRVIWFEMIDSSDNDVKLWMDCVLQLCAYINSNKGN